MAVLITGITGFIGTHVALAFLEAGYRIKGTARSAEKAEAWIALFPQYKERVSYAVVEDIAQSGAFDEAVKGCEYLVHVASPAHWNHKDNEADLLVPAIKGTKNLLAATKKEQGVKRVVLTSSLAALVEPTLPRLADAVLDEESWNMITYAEATNATLAPVAYRASKALAERAFWDYIEKEKPSWEGASICPCATFGPPMQPLHSLSALNVSNAFLWGIASGVYKAGIPTAGSPVFVDARDVALAHVRAVERKTAIGQRYLLIGGSSTPAQLVETIQTQFPQLADNLPGTSSSTAPVFHYDSSKATRELGIVYTELEKTVAATLSRILELKEDICE